MNELQNLISQITAIKKQYDKIAELTGENFNIFKILGLTSNEVRTHSAFLSELLNPKGSHGQKEVFLKLFCEKFNCLDFDYNSANVEVEKRIGLINEDYSEGGNIDILITDNKRNAIIIENKIYANDQEKQMTRYYNYAKRNHEKCYLFYLTLDGKEASVSSTNGIKNLGGIQNISYASEILTWLELCREKAVNHSIIRETITQYIHLIKYLTFQSINENMKAELFNIIINNFDSAFEIKNAYDSLSIKMKEDFSLNFKKKMNPLFDVPIKKGEFEFIYGQGDDNDGFFIGVLANVGNVGGKVEGTPILKGMAVKIRKRYPEDRSRSNHNYIGWITPLFHENKKDRVRYVDLSNEVKLQYFKNEQGKLDIELDRIYTEVKEYFEFIKKLIEETFPDKQEA